jgi:putative membrane protein
MDYYNYLKSLHLIFVIIAGLFLLYACLYQISCQNHPKKEILQAQYKIMTYRLWYIITWPSAILASILRIGCCFLLT